MKYPRIFSLSTVGLRRHYNQDYLFHPERTDFVGSNGVGKSIIADIMQLIFITDKELIKFGTDGLKKDLREPYSLPYKCSEGYAFMNIEVNEGCFICIGVCIPNNSSRRIIPFVVTQTADLSAEIAENCYNKERLLTFSQFLSGGKFLSLQELSKHLRTNHNLFLCHFTYPQDKQDYYRFLYNKHILPINLCIEANLQAFAKTIQSFSKAKAIDLDDSESLKKFLFEDSREENEQAFEKHREELDKLMIDFKELESQINDIESKQSHLKALKEKESVKNKSELEFKKAEIIVSFAQMNESHKLYKKAKEEYDNNANRRKLLEERAIKLKKLCSRTSKEFSETQNIMLALKEYAQILTGLEVIEKQMVTLENSDDIRIPDKIQTEEEIQLETFDTPDILRRIKLIKPLYEKYGSLQQMEEKVKEQQAIINKYNREISDEIQELKYVEELLSHKKKGTLFEQIINESSALTEAQETVLFSLLNVKWKKPSEISPGIRYATSLNIIDKTNIEEDNKNSGYWLKAGDIVEFIPKTSQRRLFDKPERLKEVLKERKDEIAVLISEHEERLRELNNLTMKKTYNRKKLAIEYSFDDSLLDGTALNEVKISSVIIQKKNEKVKALKKEIAEIEKKLTAVNKKYHVVIDRANINEQIETKEREEKIRKKRKEHFEDANRAEQAELLGLNKIKNTEETNVDGKKTEYNNKLALYTEKESTFFKIFPYVDKDSLFKKKYTVEQAKDLEKIWEDDKVDYVSEYKTIVQQFSETKDDREPLVKEQLDNKTYSFVILERALLGSRISHLDKITPYLEDANTERMRMMNTLHETMMKVFSTTVTKYKSFEKVIKNLNTFFKGKKISSRYYFKVNFEPDPYFSIDWIEQLKSHGRQVFRQGELPLGDSVESFIESFFVKVTGTKKKIHLAELLNPKTYFRLSVSLTDENNNEIPGSTGETYSSIILLGIGRLSKVQEDDRPGIRFMILEETANLDHTNFTTFPDIAEEFGYQLITMTPRPYGSADGKGWYVHNLIKGKANPDINYQVVASYYRTNNRKEDLITYLKAKEIA